MQSSFSLFFLLASAPILLIMAYQAYRRAPAPGARILVVLLISLAWWSICLGLVLYSHATSDMIFWARAKYLGIVLVPPSVLGFVIQYTRRYRRFNLRHIGVVLLIPLVTLIAAGTDQFHRLFYSRYYLVYSSNHLVLATEYGPFFWLHTLYSYLLLVIATVLLGFSTFSSSGTYRKQQTAILLGLLAPWLANILYLMNKDSLIIANLTPISFLVTGMTMYLAVFHYRLLDITPIARNAVVENMRDGVLVVDQDQRVLDINRILRDWLGKSQHAVVGQPVEELLPDLVQNEHCNTQAESIFEMDACFPSGRKVLEISCSPINGHKTEVIGWTFILHDVTERRQFERSLWQTKELLERMFNSINLLVVYLDREFKIIRVNKAFADRIGQPPEALVGGSFAAILPNPAWLVEFQAVLSTGETRSGSALPAMIHVNRIKGSTYWDWSLQPVNAEDGVVQGLVLTMMDVTERRLAEEELERSEKAEHEQRILAEAFRDTAAALNSTIQLDGVLSLVLSTIERVVNHDAAYVVLVSDVGDLVQWRFSGYSQAEEAQILSLRSELIDMHKHLSIQGQSRPLLVPDIYYVEDIGQELFLGRLPDLRRYRSYLGTPIRVKGRPVGYITLSSKKPSAFDTLDAGQLRVFADQAAIAVENARLYAEVQHLTMTDELTRAFNYRGLLDLGQREFDRAQRFNHPLSIMFLDIDHFRTFNNIYSHELGNQVLQQVVKVTRENLRGVDLLARYGGEEFIVLLPETHQEQAILAAERVRAAIAGSCVNAGDECLSVTVSIGVAEITAEMDSLDNLILKANQAEHIAKQNGRNCVVMVPSQAPAVSQV